MGKPYGQNNNFRRNIPNYNNNNQNKPYRPKPEISGNPKPYKDLDEPIKLEESVQSYRSLINYNDI
jgi:hypothetical protein